jgi:predicted NUDIX family NTP pyrophosphohydrolase
MVLVIRSSDGPQRFRVTEVTGVAIDGMRVRFGELEPGMRVRVNYQAEGSVALRIMAVSTQDEPPSKTGLAGGTVATVDTEQMVLVIRSSDGPQRFRVTEDTGVAIDGMRVRFGQLEPGMGVRVNYQVEGSVALRIMAVSEPSGSARGTAGRDAVARAAEAPRR